MNKHTVFFDASVIIAGILSPEGGSAKIIKMVKLGKVEGIISELIIDEVLRHSNKIKIKRDLLESKVLDFGFKIISAPETLNDKFKEIVIDIGDVHVLTSALNDRVEYLVSLDQKHILSLASNIKKFEIVSPGELIGILKL